MALSALHAQYEVLDAKNTALLENYHRQGAILGAIAAKRAVCMTSNTIQKSFTVRTVKMGTYR